MTHLECTCMKKERPRSIGRTVWTPWRRSVTWQKPDPHSINNRLDDIKAEKYGPKLIILANSFYANQRRKRTSSNPNGKVPLLLTKFAPEERTTCMMHQIIASSRTHGTRPDSKDSTPKSGHIVRYLYLPFSLFSLFLFPLQLLACVGESRHLRGIHP